MSLRLSILMLTLSFQNAFSQSLYFPPTTGSTWETIDPKSLGWCTENLDALYSYLDQEESKAFIVLKDGKIVLEKYFDTFTKDSLWYWASAGKTLTAFLVGMAQEEGKLKLSDASSKYLGVGWTQSPLEKENKITIWNQLTMTSGLDDGVSDNHCTKSECLVYKAEAGSRWAYHNAPYTLLRDVLENATGMTENQYIQSRLKAKTGMTGFWFTSDYDNVYYSTPRSMARFGLLIQNHGIWNTDSLLKDQNYFESMVNPSQQINKSYGYLWWLNGKSSFMLPTLQLVIPGPLSPEAPKDMFAGIGKNGQLICIVPSLGLVVLRMGESTGKDEVSIVLCNQMWLRLNKVLCNATSTKNDIFLNNSVEIFPNPVNNTLQLNTFNNNIISNILIYNTIGQLNYNKPFMGVIDLTGFKSGLYYIQLMTDRGIIIKTFIKT
ncbi:MAG: serine hydrolase [Saprospiraceae bacterium]|nr:serine hydrolase [Saprospiraceae bacterium]